MSNLKHVVSTNRAPAPFQGAPYTQGIIFGDLVFVAGQVGLDPESYEVVDGGIEAQTERVMQNISAILEEAGSSMKQLLKCTIFLADFDDFATVNEVYGKYVGPRAAGARHGAGRVSPQRRAGRDRRDRAPVDDKESRSPRTTLRVWTSSPRTRTRTSTRSRRSSPHGGSIRARSPRCPDR